MPKAAAKSKTTGKVEKRRAKKGELPQHNPFPTERSI